MISRIEQLCIDKGLKMTDQRRVIARVLSDATDHPDVEFLYRRAVKVDARISIASDDGRWEAAAWAKNLFDEEYRVNAYDTGGGYAA